MKAIMKDLRLKGVILLACLSLGGCAVVHSVSLSPVPRDRARPIATESHDWSFLGINFENSFVDALEVDLRKQCPQGTVSGVFTRYETFFYVLVLKRQVRASGFCVPPPPPPLPPPPETPPPPPVPAAPPAPIAPQAPVPPPAPLAPAVPSQKGS